MVLEGAEGTGVAQGAAQVQRREALAQRQDQARVVAGLSPLSRLEAGEEDTGVLTELGEGLLELIEVGDPPG